MQAKSPEHGGNGGSQPTLADWAEKQHVNLRTYLAQFGIVANGHIAPAPTHYQLLGVEQTASEKEIVAALRHRWESVALLPAGSKLRVRLEQALDKAQHDLVVDPMSRVDYDAQLGNHVLPRSPLTDIMPALEKILSHVPPPPPVEPEAPPVAQKQAWYKRPLVMAGGVASALGAVLVGGVSLLPFGGADSSHSDAEDGHGQRVVVASDSPPVDAILPATLPAVGPKEKEGQRAPESVPPAKPVEQVKQDTRQKVADVAEPPVDPKPVTPLEPEPFTAKPLTPLPADATPPEKDPQPKEDAQSEWKVQTISLESIQPIVRDLRKDKKQLATPKAWKELLQKSADQDPTHRMATYAAVFAAAQGKDPDMAFYAYEQMLALDPAPAIVRSCVPLNTRMYAGLPHAPTREVPLEKLKQYARSAELYVRDAMRFDDFDGAIGIVDSMSAHLPTAERDQLHALGTLANTLRTDAAAVRAAEEQLSRGGADAQTQKQCHDVVGRFALRKGDAEAAFLHLSQGTHPVLTGLAKRSMKPVPPDQSLSLARQWKDVAATEEGLDPLGAASGYFYQRAFPYMGYFAGADRDELRAMAHRYWWAARGEPKAWDRPAPAIAESASSRQLDLFVLGAEKGRVSVIRGSAGFGVGRQHRHMYASGFRSPEGGVLRVDLNELYGKEYDMELSLALVDFSQCELSVSVPFSTVQAEMHLGSKDDMGIRANGPSSAPDRTQAKKFIHDGKYRLLISVRNRGIHCSMSEVVSAGNGQSTPGGSDIQLDWKGIPHDLLQDGEHLRAQREKGNSNAYFGVAVSRMGTCHIEDAKVRVIGDMGAQRETIAME